MLSKIQFGKFLPWIILLLITLLLFLKNIVLPEKQKTAGVTSYSERATGLSLLKNFSDALTPNSVFLKQSAFFDAKELARYKTLLIAAPQMPPSARETKIIQEFVRRGGHLIIAADKAERFHLFAPLFAALGTEVPTVQDNESFINKQTQSVSPEVDSSIFKKGEGYEMYAKTYFREGCDRLHPFACFVRTFYVGQGEFSVFMGLPIFSNVLIERGNNRNVLFRLLKEQSPIAIDEYHHFFSDATIGNLIREYQFILPIGGFLVLTICFLLFAHTRFHERIIPKLRIPMATSFHSLSEKVLFDRLHAKSGLSEAIDLQATFLKRIFPNDSQQIQQVANNRTSTKTPALLEKARQLILFHRQQINKRRGISQ